MAKEMLLDHKLRNGSVTLEREMVDDDAVLHFTVDLKTAFPARVIFEQLLLGLSDSERSWLWPSKYESCPEPRSQGLAEGDVFRMTYRVPRFDKPEIPVKPATYSYSCPMLRREEYAFEYRSIDHPLPGGAVVRVVPIDTKTSRLSWIGAYTQKPDQAIVVQSMLRYIPFIYAQIEDNLDARGRAERPPRGTASE